MKRLALLLTLLALLAVTAALAQDVVNVPLLEPRPGITTGYEAKFQFKGRATVATFAKSGAERRLLAISAKPAAAPVGAKALQVSYDLALASGTAPNLALIVFDGKGGSWYRIGEKLVTGQPTVARIPVTSLRPTAFSESAQPEPDWTQVAYLWLGFVAEGDVKGVLNLTEAKFTNETYKPSQPLRVIPEGAGKWSVGQDPAVKSTLTTPNEGPDGKPCMKYEFTVPTGRHMYCIPSVALPAVDLEGYTALRFTYKAVIPEGMGGLLVTLGERTGSAYYAEPAPPPSADWTTITIPFSSFKLATWTKDENGRLDIGDLSAVSIGCHGGARQGTEAFGVIYVCDPQFVP